MNSRIIPAEVVHARLEPVRHGLRYRVHTFLFDLDELPGLAGRLPLFGLNRSRPIALHEDDYLAAGTCSLRADLLRMLAAEGIDGSMGQILLLTMPRVFGHVFNPVSFYFCFRPDGALRAVVAEVNNTFHEKHLYILDKAESPAGAFPAEYRMPKQFHVSPFFDRTGEYRFWFADVRQALDVRIQLYREGRQAFSARFHGQPLPLTVANYLRVAGLHPLRTLLNMPRILWQAVLLHCVCRLPVHHKPDPCSPMTIRPEPPTRLQRLGMKVVLGFLGRLRRGRLALTLPDGRTLTFGDAAGEPKAALHVRRYDFFRRVLQEADVGFGDAYMEGDWDSGDVTGVVSLFIENAEHLRTSDLGAALPGRTLNLLRHALRRNTHGRSRANVEAHYDLGNEFYRFFLDETMMYSCAVFSGSGQTLADAQRERLAGLIRKARITADCHVLEIGCGWGGFALEAVRHTGCRVTGITLSPAQLELARRRVLEAGLSDRIDLRLCDYRAVEGQYDRIVSIEMLEAVGHEYLGAFFGACDRALKPGGLALLQVITIPDERYDAYRRDPDWIRRRIFPGGHLPSLAALTEAATRHSALVIGDVENIGPHYARTLREWRARFDANRGAIRALGYDERFCRMWTYYFCYCEAAFAARYINDLQIVLARPAGARAGD